jgi:ATP-dependent Zn protease
MTQWPGQPPIPPHYSLPDPSVRFRPFRNLFGWVLFIGLAVMLFLLLQKSKSQYATIALSDFQNLLQQDKVSIVTIEGSHIMGETAAVETVKGVPIKKFQTQAPPEAMSWLSQWILQNRMSATVQVEDNGNLLVNIVVPLIPWILIFLCIWFVVFRQLRKQQQQVPYAYYPPPPPASMTQQPPMSPPPPST